MVPRALLVVVFIVCMLDAVPAIPQIDPGVHRTLREQGTVNLIVKFRNKGDNTLQTANQIQIATRGERIQHVVHALQNNANASQQEVTTFLREKKNTAGSLYHLSQSLWIENVMIFRNAKPELVTELVQFESIHEIREERVHSITLRDVSSNNTIPPQLIEWGINRIQATDIWASGIRGQGIVVGTIDSGVRGTHVALKKNFRSEYGWYDPETKSNAPYDSHGHGTHATSIIVGSNGIGVAPDAKWITCKGCRGADCREADLLECAQFITCPTDTDGFNKDCSKAPHIVSNSWGGPGNDSFFQSAVSAWHAAGIIPVFSIGNEGSKCGTAGSPGDYDNVIAVGATNRDDTIASVSSRGPTKTGRVKPDLTAPGAKINAAWNTDDNAHQKMTGTSMAAPHVSGVIALLLQAKPGIQFDAIRSLLLSTTDRNFAGQNALCGNITNEIYPNNHYGYGRINARRAILGDPSTRAPTDTPHKFCNFWQHKLSCQFWFWCKWKNPSKCVGRF